jgi:hypothetical protein
MKPRQIAYARTMRYRVQMRLREIYKVTEWRDGCVYRVRSLGFMCVPDGYTFPSGIQVGSLSTKYSRQLI